jgi:hypothetical protein
MSRRLNRSFQKNELYLFQTENYGACIMKKFLAVALVAALLVPAGTVLAANTNNGLAFFFDTRSTLSATSPQGGALGNAQWDNPIAPWSNETDNNGGRGDAQTVFVSPVIPAGTHVASGFDASVASTFLYMDVEERAGDDDIVSSVGMDIGIAQDSGDYGLDAATGVSFTMFNDAADVGGGATSPAWDDTAVGTVGVTGISGIKAVRVPVDGVVPAYNPDLGLGVGGTYRLASVTFQGGDRPPFVPGNAPLPAVFSAKMAVNSLLITRVYNPAGGAGATPELPDFGYLNGQPEAAAVPGIGGTADGSSEGTTSTAADMVIVVKAKGDFNQDGNMTNDDINAFIAAFVSTLTNDVEARWTVDFTGDNLNTNDDINAFIAQFLQWGVN